MSAGTSESVPTVDELERTPQGIVKRWIAELDIAERAEKEWVKAGRDAFKIYKSEEKTAFNILWSNTETMRPALYNSMPEPDVRRRFRDKDPVGKYAALVLKRGLKYEIDAYDFDKVIQDAVLDVLLPGRGVARVKYDPTITAVAGYEPDPISNEPAPEQITDEYTLCEHVQWDKFRRGPGEKWEQVPWVAFEHDMPRDQLIEYFGEDLAEKIPLTDSLEYGNTRDKTIQSLVQTAKIWEIWDKTDRRVLFICEQYKAKPLKNVPDPLHLKDFLPLPRPIYAIEDSTSLIPQTLYDKYKTQAEELNDVTRRISKVVKALKVRGAYAANMSELSSVIEASDNQMIPITNASEVAAMGGLDKAIWIMPIDKLAGVLNDLYIAREKTLQTIYEITGLGDIMRGVSNPHETLGAQQLKSQWGTLRLQRLQREVQRFIRDLMRLKAEIIAEHFQQQTLQQMTDLELPTAQQKQQIQQQIAMAQQQAQQTQQQIPPETMDAATHLLSLPTWEDVMSVLQSDEMRSYRIGIETDSTIQETLTRDSQAMQEAVTGMVNLFTGLAPFIEGGGMSVEVAKNIALSLARNAKMGEFVEDAIEQLKQPPPAQPPVDNSLQVAQLKAQSDQSLGQLREQNKQQMQDKQLAHEKSIAQLEAQLEQAKTALEAQGQKLEVEAQKQIAEMQEMVKVSIAKMTAASQEKQTAATLIGKKAESDASRSHEAQQAGADREHKANVETDKLQAKREGDAMKTSATLVGMDAKAEDANAQRAHEKASADQSGSEISQVLKAIQALMEMQAKPRTFKFETDKKGDVVGATSEVAESDGDEKTE